MLPFPFVFPLLYFLANWTVTAPLHPGRGVKAQFEKEKYIREASLHSAPWYHTLCYQKQLTLHRVRECQPLLLLITNLFARLRWLWSLKNVPCSPITWATVMYLPSISPSHHPGCHTDVQYTISPLLEIRHWQYNEGLLSFEGTSLWKQQILYSWTLYHPVILSLFNAAVTIWKSLQINCWRLGLQTKCSVYVKKGTVDTLQLIKPDKRGVWI